MKESIKKSNCDFAEELVSYLYGEINATDKSNFDNHLPGCSSCREELAEFSFARATVQEWRDTEFAPLKNPTIEIPYPNRSWTAVIRQYFAFSPAWLKASTAFAALAMCAVLFAVAVSSRRNDGKDIAGKQTNQNAAPISPTPTVANVSVPDEVPPKLIDPVRAVEQRTPTVNQPTKIVAKPSVLKPQTVPTRTVQPKSTKAPTAKPVKTQLQKAPSLVDDEPEQDSLTLTDLLEEIGSKEKDEKR